jgi:hypothetical protein
MVVSELPTISLSQPNLVLFNIERMGTVFRSTKTRIYALAQFVDLVSPNQFAQTTHWRKIEGNSILLKFHFHVYTLLLWFKFRDQGEEALSIAGRRPEPSPSVARVEENT